MRTTIIILLLLSVTSSWGQKQVYKINLNIDDSIVYKIADSLLKEITKEIVVVQTLKPFNYVVSNDSFLTFIIWKESKTTKAIIASEDNIYEAIHLDTNSIFNYPNRNLTFVTKDEETLKFVPPLIFGNVVYVITKGKNNYFELTDDNQPLTYYPTDKKKEALRKSYFKCIYHALSKVNYSLKVQASYNRTIK